MYTVEQIIELIRSGKKKKFYDDIFWKNLSKQILKRDNYECQECKKERKVNNKRT